MANELFFQGPLYDGFRRNLETNPPTGEPQSGEPVKKQYSMPNHDGVEYDYMNGLERRRIDNQRNYSSIPNQVERTLDEPIELESANFFAPNTYYNEAGREFRKNNPYGVYKYENKNRWVTNEQLEQRYQDMILYSRAKAILDKNPQSTMSRVDYLNSLTPDEQKVLQAFSNKFNTNVYGDSWRGVKKAVSSSLLGPKGAIQSIQSSTDLTKQEKADRLRELSPYGVVNTAMGALDALEIFEIPANAIINTNYSRSRGADDITSGSALGGQRPKQQELISTAFFDATNYLPIPALKGEQFMSKLIKTGSRLRNAPTTEARNAEQAISTLFPGTKTTENVVVSTDYQLLENIKKSKGFIEDTPKLLEYQPPNNLVIKSIEDGSPLEKMINKRGEINRNNLQAYINKNSTSKGDKHILQKVLDEDFPDKKNINYQELKNKTSGKLVELDFNKIDKYANNGLENIGFTNTNIQSVESNLDGTYNIFKVDKKFKSKAEADEYLKTLLPKENKTITFHNIEKFGGGSSRHFDRGTLGHTRYLVSNENPDIFHVLESQSDFYQNKKFVDFGLEKRRKSIKRSEEILEENKHILKNMKEKGRDNFGNPVQQYQIQQLEKIIKNNSEVTKMRKGTIANYEQKKLLGDKHQERLLQENIAYAAKNGQTKVRYPTSETAVKVQGYKPVTTSQELIEDYNLAKGTPEFDIQMKSLSKGDKVLLNKILKGEVKGDIYEEKVRTILKKYNNFPKMVKKTMGIEPKIVTDTKGNTWYELDIPEDFLKGKGKIRALSTIPAVGLGSNTIDNDKGFLPTKKMY